MSVRSALRSAFCPRSSSLPACRSAICASNLCLLKNVAAPDRTPITTPKTGPKRLRPSMQHFLMSPLMPAEKSYDIDDHFGLSRQPVNQVLMGAFPTLREVVFVVTT